eukprot:366539-Chlamydomonas_euryale.AAC.13
MHQEPAAYMWLPLRLSTSLPQHGRVHRPNCSITPKSDISAVVARLTNRARVVHGGLPYKLSCCSSKLFVVSARLPVDAEPYRVANNSMTDQVRLGPDKKAASCEADGIITGSGGTDLMKNQQQSLTSKEVGLGERDRPATTHVLAYQFKLRRA